MTNKKSKVAKADMDAKDEFSPFALELIERLKLRTDLADGDAYTLDLRHRRFAFLGRLTLRCPTDAGWPKYGRTTNNLGTAKEWVRDAYAQFINLAIAQRQRDAMVAAPSVAPSPLLTVGQACTKYLHALANDPTTPATTLRNRRSTVGKHIVPKLGPLVLAALTENVVREWLNDLRVRASDGNGGRVEKPAALGTRRDVRACLKAVWKHTMGKTPAPFAGIELTDPAARADFREKIRNGNLEVLLAPRSGAYTPTEVRRILAAARWYDQTQIASRRNTRTVAVPNTAAAMALLIGTGMRVDELCLLRWKCIDELHGAIWVLGTKTLNAPRLIPLQEQLRPWLEELRRLAAPVGASPDWAPDPEAFVVRTNPRRPSVMASAKTIGARFTEVLRWAGLKRPGKATHWARATHASWGRAASRMVSIEDLQDYLGHGEAHGETTSVYITSMAELLPEDHKRYIQHLPDPETATALAADFEPVERPGWRNRRPRWTPRDKVSRERRREAQRAAKAREEASGSTEGRQRRSASGSGQGRSHAITHTED